MKNLPVGNESTGWKAKSTEAILSAKLKGSKRFGRVGSVLPVQIAHDKGGQQPHLTVTGLAAFFDTRCKPDVRNNFRFL